MASALPWHRNGCAFFANGKHYVLYVRAHCAARSTRLRAGRLTLPHPPPPFFCTRPAQGETYSPAYPGRYIAGIGLATTADFRTFDVVNATLMVPDPVGPDPEVCLEAATAPVQLASGDWLHVFAAGTQGWGPWGPGMVMGSYVAGFLILDRDDPSVILQRDVVHFFRPTMDYEAGTNPRWPVCRNRTLFVTTLVPIAGQENNFTAWYGAADANVATAVVSVKQL